MPRRAGSPWPAPRSTSASRTASATRLSSYASCRSSVGAPCPLCGTHGQAGRGSWGGDRPCPKQLCGCCGVIQPGGSQQGARGGGLVGAAATSWELGDPLLGRALPLAALPPLHPLPPCCSPSLGWSWAAPDGLLPSLRSHPGRQRGAGAGGEAEVNAELVAQPGWRVGGDQPPSSKISPPAQTHPAPGMPSPSGEPRLGSGTVLMGLGRGQLGPR